MAEKEYIEREAAIRVLCDACGNAACPKGLIPRCSYYEKMQSIPAADVRPVKWIPVTERLPEKNCEYLVYVYGEVTEMNFWHGKWHMLGHDYTQAVTHWMPLPEPPKEE